MITPQQFLDTEIQMGISLDNPNFLALADATVNQLDIAYETVMDYGAGTGVYANAFHKAGKKVKVFEIWEPHRQYIKDRMPHLQIIDKPEVIVDLMLWIEVAEHMTDEEISKLMSSINPTYILFSSTSQHNPGFDEQWGHINIKEQDEWIRLFDRCGYLLFKELKFPTPYSKLFKRK
jgi:2-polyprenyl-3-methyl-5-hydroxy-6-metoxy-1,4-benzoquinol methylase